MKKGAGVKSVGVKSESVTKKQLQKSLLARAWNFLWHDDSWASVFAFLIVSIVLIRFVVYPVLGFALGSSQPVVAVISESMVHDRSFDSWWNETLCKQRLSEEYAYQKEFYSSWNITKQQFEGFTFKNGFNKGDVIVLVSPKNINVGDVIVATNNGVTAYPVIHRVVSVRENSITTNGDNNQCEIWDFERSIPKQAVIGKALFRIPYLGWIKVLAVDIVSALFGGG